MDPISLGIIAAALFAKKVIERLGERTGDKVADSVAPLRDHIGELLEGGNQDPSPLVVVERTPDSKIAVTALAAAITEASKVDPQGASKLDAFVGTMRSDEEEAVRATFHINLNDNAEVDKIYQAGRDITFNRD